MGPEETRGVEWDWAPPDDDWVPGMGWGASEDARRWAKLGQLLEFYASLKFPAAKKNKGGRHKKPDGADHDTLRVLLCYQIIKSSSKRPLSSWTREEIASYMQSIKFADPEIQQLFNKCSQGSLESSISRGKNKIGIPPNSKMQDWEVCEKFWNSFSHR